MTRREIRSWLMDMDGVLVREQNADAGRRASSWRGCGSLSSRSSSSQTTRSTPSATSRRGSARTGLEVPEEAIWTSALATAQFLDDQRPGGSAFVIGESGLTTALHGVGYTLSERDPDYVVLGETRTYSFERITQAIRLIAAGSRFIATNPDNVGPTPEGPLPATGSVAALDQPRDGRRSLLRGQAEPADDALCP